MNNLIIKTAQDTPFIPNVNFDVATGLCEISASSYMEDAYKFYMPIIKWLREFIELRNKKLILNFKLNYFNTSSSRCILDILEVIKEFIDSGGDVSVNWYYDKNDPDMLNDIEDMEIESKVLINRIEI